MRGGRDDVLEFEEEVGDSGVSGDVGGAEVREEVEEVEGEEVGKVEGEGVKVEEVSGERVDEERLVDWAYRVMDWLKVASSAGAWSKIAEHAEDIVSAFMVLVKEEHRPIVMETIKAVGRAFRGGGRFGFS